MPNNPRNTKQLLRILDPSKKLPFTEAAQDLLDEKAILYRTELTQQSILLAVREDLDIVSPAHIEHGAEQLKSRNKKTHKAMGIIGGAVGGASLSTLLSIMVLEAKITIVPGAILISLLVLGCLGVALEVLRR